MALVMRQAMAVDGLALGRPMQRRAFGRFSRQVEISTAVTVETDAGELVAMAGMFEGDGAEGAECWFVPGPTCTRHLLGLVRLLRSVLAVGTEATPGLACVAYIDPGSVAGDRLAAMLGFTEAGLTETLIGPLRTWRRIL